MADGVFNVAKGRVNELVSRVENNDPANSALIVVALQATAADATLEDFDTLDAVLSDGGTTESTFTSYARQTITDSSISAPTVDDSGNEQFSVIPDIVYTDATTGQAMVKILICYDSDTTSGNDLNIVPLTHHDVSVTTDGNTLTFTIPDDGFYGAT